MKGRQLTSIAAVFHRVALPLGCYYAVTLALPLANGAGQSGVAFRTHATAVLIVPLLLVLLAYATSVAARAVVAGAARLKMGPPARAHAGRRPTRPATRARDRSSLLAWRARVRQRRRAPR